MTSRRKPQKKRSNVPWFVGGGILALLLIAFLTTGLSGDGNDDGNGTGASEFADVTVTGAALPDLPQNAADPAVGMLMPELDGQGFNGTSISITNDGRPKAILFLAHW